MKEKRKNGEQHSAPRIHLVVLYVDSDAYLLSVVEGELWWTSSEQSRKVLPKNHISAFSLRRESKTRVLEACPLDR